MKTSCCRIFVFKQFMFVYLLISLITSCISFHNSFNAVFTLPSVSRLTASTADLPVSESSKLPSKSLTQKEYLIAVRNRLFAVEEQLWLHEFAIAHPKSTRVKPLSEKKLQQFNEVKRALLNEYPLTRLHIDLEEAKLQKLNYAVIYIERLIDNFKRQVPLSLQHVNQIAVLSNQGSVMNLMRGQGLVHQRLLPTNTQVDKGVKRQFQHPVFSSSGRYVAFGELNFKEGVATAKSNAVIYDVPTDPNTYGSADLSPIYDSGDLQGTPFLLQFSPDEDSITMLTSTPPVSPEDLGGTSLITTNWGKQFRKESWAGRAAVQRFIPRQVTTLLRGKVLFFSYTTSSAQNATIVAHCQRDVVDQTTKQVTSEKSVLLLEQEDNAGVKSSRWTKISDSDKNVRWPTPITHSAGGGDNVIIVEDGFVTTKAISRWKRLSNSTLPSKRLLKVQGQVQFLVSPDHSRLVVLQEDINVGCYSLTVIEGEAALDPSNPSLGVQYEMPHQQLTVAFWFSPDSTKLLCLTSSDKTKQDIETMKSTLRIGLNSDMKWIVFNFPLQEWKDYDTFKPTPYFMKTFVPFFSQYASSSFNPWAPDSKSFLYISSNGGLVHIPLVENQPCLGKDKWQNQGGTYATWCKC